MPKKRKLTKAQLEKLKQISQTEIEQTKQKRDAVNRQIDRHEEAKKRLAHKRARLPWYCRICK